MTNTRTLDRDCCDYEVYSHGKVIGVFDMPKDEANQLVVKLSKKTGNRIDWHYVGGNGNVTTKSDSQWKTSCIT